MTTLPYNISDKPRHIAIIMDGNGRWANQRSLPRIAGHKSGVEAVRSVVQSCAKREIEVLTLFAFSSENWRRPEKEVNLLMDLFLMALKREIVKLDENNVYLRVIGDRNALPEKIQIQIDIAEKLTQNNTGLKLVIATNYGGRWDITQAVRRLLIDSKDKGIEGSLITEELIRSYLMIGDLPEPDLFIRTGGEQRISNFLLWQLAYTELYFTDKLWPDFDTAALDAALASYAKRQRRFGHTGEQVEQARGA